jgi:hypothetical protein
MIGGMEPTTYAALGITLAVVVILTFVVQILMGRIHGIVLRSTIIIGAAVVILAVTTGVLALIG